MLAISLKALADTVFRRRDYLQLVEQTFVSGFFMLNVAPVRPAVTSSLEESPTRDVVQTIMAF